MTAQTRYDLGIVLKSAIGASVGLAITGVLLAGSVYNQQETNTKNMDRKLDREVYQERCNRVDERFNIMMNQNENDHAKILKSLDRISNGLNNK